MSEPVSQLKETLLAGGYVPVQLGEIVEQVARLEQEVGLAKQSIVELQHERNELSKAVALANQKIAELEAEKHSLETDIDDLHFLNKWGGERIAELETWVRDVLDTIEDNRHRRRGQELLEKGK